MMTKLSRDKMLSVLPSLLIILIAVVLISIILLATGANPILFFMNLFKGSFGTKRGLINTISKAVPICLSAFAVALANKVGVFNIGVEGQLVFGALGSAIAGIYLQELPAIIHIPLALFGGILFGMLYAYLPTWMYIKQQANLMVVFIMMNNLAKLFSTFVIIALIQDPASMVTASQPIQKSAYLPMIMTSPGKLNISVFILIAVAILIYVFFYKTVYGYEMTACGVNGEAADYSGINTRKYIKWALILGGALAGLAGAIEVQGTYFKLYDGFSPGYGFDGIPIALLSNNNPLFMMVGSLLFAALRVGSNTTQIEQGISGEIVTVIQGILVTLIACEYFIRYIAKRSMTRKKGRRMTI